MNLVVSIVVYPVLSEQALYKRGFQDILVYWKPKKSSDDGEEVTPVPIPNTEVKLFSADGSWGFPPARVGRRWALKKVVTELIGNDFFVV